MKQLYFYMFNVVVLIYISLPSWPNINTSCTMVDRKRFSVFKIRPLSLGTYALDRAATGIGFPWYF
jgi:hypothetical protein